MEVYFAFESVSVFMIWITIFFYNYKNWLPLRKNRIYMRLLLICVVMLTIDLTLLECSLYFTRYKDILQEISGISMNLGFPILFIHILLYDLSITKRMRIIHNLPFRIFVAAGIVIGLFSVVAILSDIGSIFIGYGTYPVGAGNIMQIVFLALCLLIGIGYVILSRKVITRREVCVLSGTDFLLCIGLFLQVLLKTRTLASYYTITLVLVLYYLVLHNSDQYRFLSSGCFSRNGFNDVISEKAHYRENFSCLGICINNIESITNYCTEQEIMLLHRRLGDMLRYYCGRRNIYNIHSFEYMALLKNNEGIKRVHKEIAEGIPPYIRINNKNIPLLCDFYAVEFADARYDARDFNRILTSMRKLAITNLNRHKLLWYQGDKQLEIQNDLEAMRVVNDCIAKRKINYQILPIQSLTDIDKMSYEMILCETLENNTVVSQERIWELANETGYNKRVGYVACEMLCDYVEKEKILEKENIERVHLNITPNQLFSPKVAEGYVQILSERNIPGECICFEVTIDQNVDYERLTESFMVLKQYGIRLLLDQFGVCVCNLKNVLNMPFDFVKLNNYMVYTYCFGESRQLEYLVNMLKAKDWEIYLDGVDRLEQIEIIRDLDISAIQGYALSSESFRRQLRAFFRIVGGESDE